jgi:hypothetical protein
MSRKTLFEPGFYLAVDNYTVLQDGIERTIASPLKKDSRETPSPNQGE